MKYLITGITGFAGPHLANLLLANGHIVHGLVRGSNGMETDILDVVSAEDFNKIVFLYGNLRDKYQLDKILKTNQYDGVFHLAAQSHPPTSFEDPIGTFQDNVIGSINLIESIIQFSPETKLMFCSTSEVYGNEGINGQLLKEDNKILPSNPYGNSKAAIDLYMQERMTNKLIKGFITRAFSHTGPRRGKKFSISCDAYQLASMRLGNDSRILKVGNLSTTRVVLDVRDVVNAYYRLMLTDKSIGKIYNVCGDTPRKMQFFTDKLIEISKIERIEKEIDSKFYRPFDIYYQHGDSTRLKNDTEWYPNFDIDTTLKDLFNYWLGKLSKRE